MTQSKPNPPNNTPNLSHRRLRVYGLALDFAAWVHLNPIPRSNLRAQATRAANSVVLNIAEAAGLDGRRGAAQFRIARGSTLEVLAAYELSVRCGDALDIDAFAERGALIAAMLSKLSR